MHRLRLLTSPVHHQHLIAWARNARSSSSWFEVPSRVRAAACRIKGLLAFNKAFSPEPLKWWRCSSTPRRRLQRFLWSSGRVGEYFGQIPTCKRRGSTPLLAVTLAAHPRHTGRSAADRVTHRTSLASAAMTWRTGWTLTTVSALSIGGTTLSN